MRSQFLIDEKRGADPFGAPFSGKRGRCSGYLREHELRASRVQDLLPVRRRSPRPASPRRERPSPETRNLDRIALLSARGHEPVPLPPVIGWVRRRPWRRDGAGFVRSLEAFLHDAKGFYRRYFRESAVKFRCRAIPAAYVRIIRANVIETMNEDYVRTARAKGLSEVTVMRGHVLRNVMLPVVTILGIDIGLARRRDLHRDRLQPPGPRPHVGAGARKLRRPDGAGRDRLRDDRALIVFNLIVRILYAAIDPRIRLT
jgi:Binding-protein-dependent transport system inner membrane component